MYCRSKFNSFQLTTSQKAKSTRYISSRLNEFAENQATFGRATIIQINKEV